MSDNNNVMDAYFGEFSIKLLLDKDDPNCILGVNIYSEDKLLCRIAPDQFGDLADLAEYLIDGLWDDEETA